MSGFRYPQFCPLARAAEILGERWTLLLIREARPARRILPSLHTTWKAFALFEACAKAFYRSVLPMMSP